MLWLLRLLIRHGLVLQIAHEVVDVEGRIGWHLRLGCHGMLLGMSAHQVILAAVAALVGDLLSYLLFIVCLAFAISWLKKPVLVFEFMLNAGAALVSINHALFALRFLALELHFAPMRLEHARGAPVRMNFPSFRLVSEMADIKNFLGLQFVVITLATRLLQFLQQ